MRARFGPAGAAGGHCAEQQGAFQAGQVAPCPPLKPGFHQGAIAAQQHRVPAHLHGQSQSGVVAPFDRYEPRQQQQQQLLHYQQDQQNRGFQPSIASTAAYRRRAADDGRGTGAQSCPPLVVGLIALAAFACNADQSVAAANLQRMADDFGMTALEKDIRLGALTQMGFFLVGGACSVLIGPMCEAMDRSQLLVGVVLSGALPSFLISMVPNGMVGFVYFLLCRMMTGVAVGGAFPVLYSLMGDFAAPHERSKLSSLISAATAVGQAFGAIGGGVLGARLGWRTVYFLCSLVGFVAAAITFSMLKDPRDDRVSEVAAKTRLELAGAAAEGGDAESGFGAQQGALPADSSDPDFLWNSAVNGPVEGFTMEKVDMTMISRVLKVKTNTLVFAQALPGCVPIAIITTYLPDYLRSDMGVSADKSAFIMSVFGVAGLFFGLAGGTRGSTLMAESHEKFCLAIAAVQVAAAVPFMLLVNFAPGSVGGPLSLIMAAAGGVIAGAGPNLRMVLMAVNSSELRGSAFSVMTLCDDLGKGLGPLVIVALIAILGRRGAFTVGFMFWGVSACIVALRLPAALAAEASRGRRRGRD